MYVGTSQEQNVVVYSETKLMFDPFFYALCRVPTIEYWSKLQIYQHLRAAPLKWSDFTRAVKSLVFLLQLSRQTFMDFLSFLVAV